MKKAIGTMIMLAASAGALMTPAVAATRDQRDFGAARQTDYRTNYGVTVRQNDFRSQGEVRRTENARLRDVRLRNERNRHERDNWRSGFDRDDRW